MHDDLTSPRRNTTSSAGATGGGMFPAMPATSTGPSTWTNTGPSNVPAKHPPAQPPQNWARRVTDLLASFGGHRGRAVSELAVAIRERHVKVDTLDSLELAVDLLAAESDAACEALAALLAGGWEGTLGEALSCARSL